MKSESKSKHYNPVCLFPDNFSISFRLTKIMSSLLYIKAEEKNSDIWYEDFFRLCKINGTLSGGHKFKYKKFIDRVLRKKKLTVLPERYQVVIDSQLSSEQKSRKVKNVYPPRFVRLMALKEAMHNTWYMVDNAIYKCRKLYAYCDDNDTPDHALMLLQNAVENMVNAIKHFEFSQNVLLLHTDSVDDSAVFGGKLSQIERDLFYNKWIVIKDTLSPRANADGDAVAQHAHIIVDLIDTYVLGDTLAQKN